MSEEEPQSTCDVCDPRGQQKAAWCQQSQESFVGSLMTTLPAAAPAVLRDTGPQAHSLEPWRALSKKYLDILSNRSRSSRP